MSGFFDAIFVVIGDSLANYTVVVPSIHIVSDNSEFEAYFEVIYTLLVQGSFRKLTILIWLPIVAVSKPSFSGNL